MHEAKRRWLGRPKQEAKENATGNAKTEGKGIDSTQGKATSKTRQSHGEQQREGLARGRASRDSLGNAKMKDKIKENAARNTKTAQD